MKLKVIFTLLLLTFSASLFAEITVVITDTGNNTFRTSVKSGPADGVGVPGRLIHFASETYVLMAITQYDPFRTVTCVIRRAEQPTEHQLAVTNLLTADDSQGWLFRIGIAEDGTCSGFQSSKTHG